MAPQEFIKLIAPSATLLYQKYNVFASITIAQCALESGWGQSVPVGSNNYFGIKWTPDYTGGYVESWTHEVVNGKRISVKARFRVYKNIYDSLHDHAKFLLENPRYKPVLNSSNGIEAAKQLQVCGYATDTNYANLLIGLINQYNLQQYDIKEIDNVIKENFKIKVNGKIIYLQKELPLIDGSVNVPLREFAKLLNASVDYANNTINIIKGGK